MAKKCERWTRKLGFWRANACEGMHGKLGHSKGRSKFKIIKY